jgi:hypothetical protein
MKYNTNKDKMKTKISIIINFNTKKITNNINNMRMPIPPKYLTINPLISRSYDAIRIIKEITIFTVPNIPAKKRANFPALLKLYLYDKNILTAI